MPANKFIAVAVPAMLLALYALFLAHPVNLATADLGRHLANGRELFENHHLVQTNFYSYTHPGFPTLNHHWGSGALFYLVFKAFGFAGVHAFFILIALTAFFLFFRIASRYGGLLPASLLSLAVIPLLGQRAEVRPEIFSYLFAGIIFWILLEVRSKKISGRWLWLLPAIEVFWVNSHIYFFLVPALIAAFILACHCERSARLAERERGWEAVPSHTGLLRRLLTPRNDFEKKLLVIFPMTLLATFLNPFFIKGMIAPFTIWQNYGYALAENQTLWDIERLLPGNPNYFLFKIVLFLLAASFVYAYVKRKEINWALLFIALGVSAIGLLQLRNFALFGLFAVAIISSNLSVVASGSEAILVDPGLPRPRSGSVPHNDKAWWAMAIAALALLLALSGELSPLFPQLQRYRLGLAPGVTKAAEFWRENNLQGPIFNNYDIGGYLIYTLYPSPLAGEGGRRPDEGVFVDNRPEAYPASFFREEYIPMQENEETWQKALQKYGFNSIFFWWRDFTPWAQQFLAARAQDPQWKRVYLDDYAIIFARVLSPSPISERAGVR